MCHAHSTLIYGLWVTTASLVFASTAYKNTRNPFIAIDLINLRRNAGSLQAPAFIRQTPPEVWERVKRHLVQDEMEIAELKEISQLRCEYCLQQDAVTSMLLGVLSGRQRGKIMHEWHTWGPPPNGCEACWEIVYEDVLVLQTPSVRKNMKGLLAEYGLALATDREWPSDPETEFHDFDSLLAITLPMRDSTPSPRYNTLVSAEADHSYEGASTHKVANISPDVLRLTPDAARRFAALVKLYPLKMVDRASCEILPPAPARCASKVKQAKEDGGDGAEKEKEKQKVVGQRGRKESVKKEFKFGPAEPRWMVWSVFDPCM